MLLALVVVTVITALAAGMIWQQWRSVQAETAERARSQAQWILTGAIDWARLILREDARGSQIDHLGEPWAVPLQEARLSTFLANGRDDLEDNPALQAFVSGSIVDAQSRFNLRNLAVEGEAAVGPLRVLQRICSAAGVPDTVTALVADGVKRSWLASKGESAGGRQAALLSPQRLDDLAWWGIDARDIERLRPWIVILPRPTPVNLNTASADVLAAALDGVDAAGVQRLVQARSRSPLRTLDQALAVLQGGRETGAASAVSVQSNFFEVSGRLRLGERVFEEQVLVERRQLEMVVLQRQRTQTLVASR